MPAKKLTIPADVNAHLGGVDVLELTGFTCEVDGHFGWAKGVTGGGFGLPAWIISISTTEGSWELGLIEKDGEDYSCEQDGSAPLEVDGWAWREFQENSSWSFGWSDEFYETAGDALCAAMKSTAITE